MGGGPGIRICTTTHTGILRPPIGPDDDYP
jgi:hypothetical protein